MERLTERYGDGYIGVKGCTTAYLDKERKGAYLHNAIVRLSAYEDTGLEPEEVEALKKAKHWREIEPITTFEGIPIERAIELAQAEKDGRLVVLPCRLGDFVYDIDFKKNNIILSKVAAVFATETEAFPGVLISLELITIDGERPGEMHYVYADDIGKTWFLTRQEAEEALREANT